MDLVVALVFHVLAVVLLIGGGDVVSAVVTPAIAAARPPQERLAAYVRFEGWCAPQARVAAAVTGLSGL